MSAERRLIIAARIASIMAFCNKTSILIEGTTSHDRNILHISEVGESVMKSQVGDFNFTREHVKETITQTSIFNSRGSNLFGFSHFAISEYLAAKYLIWNMLPTEKLKSLTTISTDSECKTIPQIKNTTAWLSTLSKDFFLLSVKNDPQNILIGDIGNMEDELKFKLVEALIKQLDKQLINDADWSLSSHYRKLKHPLLHEQLNPIISNKHAYYLTRRVSISIAGACTVYDSINALQKVVFDEMDNIHIRTSAASALAAYGLPEILKILKPLAIKYQRSDTDDGLKGIALSALWPNYLSSKELFSSITIPRRENFTGSYAMFLYHLYNNFQSEYVEDGLYWLSTFNINNREIQYKFERLVNLILYQAWNNIAKISNLEVFSKVIAKRLLNHENIFPLSNDYKAQPYKYNIDVDNRFKIVRLLLKRIEPDKVHLLTNIGNHELVNDNEFVVVFNLFLAEDDLEMKNNWAELLKYLFIWNVTNISLIAENIDKYTELEKAFGSRFKTIELDSEEAVNQKVIFDENLKREKEREKRRNKRNTKKVDVQQILKSDLKHFEETNDNKWWYKLFLNLTLEDNGYYKEDEHKAIVEELSGWQYIDEDIEKRFIKSGKNYILNFSENSKKWLGKDIMYRPAISGYKTLLYLLKKDPQFISNLEPEHWQNWMYIMLTYLEPYSSGEDKTYLELLNQAYENAPNYFLIAFEKVALLQCKEESASFNVIEKVNLFFDKKIESVLLKILQKHDLNIAAKSYLLGVLLERNNIVAYKITKEIALQKDSSSEILAITSVFINYCTTKDWEIIKNKITTNVQFGKELFLSYPEQRQYNSNKPLYARLTEIQLAELYIWLANHFPKEKYPDTSGLHKPDKNGYVWQIRASLISSLELKGSAASIEALKYISTKVSNVDFSYNRILANASYRKNNWNPLEAKELIQYIDKANSKVIQNEDDLIKLLIESLNRASIVLQGANPMSFSLWDENKPKNEEALSAYLNNFIKTDLDSFPLLSFREVQFRPPKTHEGAKKGEKVDILITSINPDTNQEINVIIEVKGSWNTGVNESMKGQLFDRYLSNGVTTHGIYLIGWYNCAYWSIKKKNSIRQKTIKGARSHYKKQAERLSVNGKVIKSFVLDCRNNN